MRKHTLAILVASFALGSSLFVGRAHADGLLLRPSELPAKARSSIEVDIGRARAASPGAFARLDALWIELPSIDASKHGRYPELTHRLVAMGPDALWPMLERLAIDAPARGSLSDSGWDGWRASLVEAVGELRDGRAAPVLRAILEGPNTEPLIVEAAAAAYGKLGTDEASRKLVAMSALRGPKQRPILAGMGHCRRLAVAQELAAALEAMSDGASTKLLARSLARVAGAWVWQSPGATHTDEAEAIRLRAAQALIGVFASRDARARRELTKAILVVDHPRTPAMIESAKADASAEGVAALVELAVRFANSPFHR